MLQVTINTEIGNPAGPYEHLGSFAGPEAETRAKAHAEAYARENGITGGTGLVVMVGEPGSLPTQGFTADEGWMTGGYRPSIAIPGIIEAASAD